MSSEKVTQIPDIPQNLKTQNWNSSDFFFFSISNEEKSTALITSTLLKDR